MKRGIREKFLYDHMVKKFITSSYIKSNHKSNKFTTVNVYIHIH